MSTKFFGSIEMDKTNNEISVAFTLTDFDCDPEEITARVGITPTKTWRVGDFINKKKTMKYEYNGWKLHSKIEKNADLESHIISVLEQLKSGWESLVKISQSYYTEISCAIYIYSDTERPAIHFSKQIIQKIAELNAEIDVDIYILTDE